MAAATTTPPSAASSAATRRATRGARSTSTRTAADNPLKYTDPTGLTWYKPWTWGLNTEGTVGNRQIGERWQIDGTWFEEVQLPDGTRTPLQVGSRVVNDPDGGYHIQYPDGHVSHAGRPDNCARGSALCSCTTRLILQSPQRSATSSAILASRW